MDPKGSIATNSLWLQKPKAKAAPKKTASKAAPKKLTQTTLTAKPATKAKAASKKRAKPDSDDDDNIDEDDDHMSDDSMLSHTPPKKAKKSAGPTKKGGSKPLADLENESFGFEGSVEPSKKTDVSEKYQKASIHDAFCRTHG